MSEVQNNSRTYNVILNSVIGIVASLIQVVLNYVVRIILVKELGEEINGIHNLFQSIANVMALMEAGFSTAMIIHLYKPVKDRDEQKTKVIMAFYRRIYVVIGTAFFIVALIIDMFVIEHIVTTSIPMWQVKVYFAVFSLSFVFDYYTYHKRSLLLAEQKNRISIAITTISGIVFRTMEIISVILWHNYFLFLVLMILEKLSGNVICTSYVNKHHPYLKSYNGEQIDVETKKSIYQKVRPLFVYNISSTVQQSSKSILVSALLGNVSIVGYFGNYQLVVGTAQLLFSQFGGAFTTAFGNLAVEKNKDNMFRAYRKTAFVINWMAIVVCAGFTACIQDFILFTFGEKFVLGITNVLILSLDMFAYLLNIPIISVQNAMGLHAEDKYYMIIQAIIALILGYFGGIYFGMPGILCGLMLPQIVLTLFNKGIIIYRVAFDKKPMEFIRFILREMGKYFLVISLVLFISNFIKTGNVFIDFFLKGIFAIGISLTLFVALSYRSEFFKEYLMAIKVKNGRKT